MLGSLEHYELMDMFEREHSGRMDRESRELWPRGIVYQDGRTNELFLTYRRGYAFGYAFGKAVCAPAPTGVPTGE